MWIILPIGLLLLVASGYAVFEKEAVAATVALSEQDGTEQKSLPVMALTGVFVKTAAGAGKGLVAAGRAIGRTGGRLFR